MGDAMVGSWGDPADVRPSSAKLGGGLKPDNFKPLMPGKGQI